MNTDDVGSVRPQPPTPLSMHICSPSTQNYKQILNKHKTRDSLNITLPTNALILCHLF